VVYLERRAGPVFLRPEHVQSGSDFSDLTRLCGEMLPHIPVRILGLIRMVDYGVGVRGVLSISSLKIYFLSMATVHPSCASFQLITEYDVLALPARLASEFEGGVERAVVERIKEESDKRTMKDLNMFLEKASGLYGFGIFLVG